MRTYILLLAFTVALASCKDAQKSKTQSLDRKMVTEEVQSGKTHPGKRIMEQECYICHDPKASMTNRIAPAMEAIKRHYIDSSVTKEEFTEALIRWVNDPETATKIPGAHKKFGPMPYMPNPDDAIAQIADYIYDNELERPEGFDAHFQKAHKKSEGMRECNCFDYPEPEAQYGAVGLAYAKEAKALLGKNLKRAIQEKGTIAAVRFCTIEATKLTDSISMMKNAVIKRVSDKTRNPGNQANAMELQHITSFKEMVALEEKIEPVVQIENDEVNVYYPITTNAICLQCHGKPDKQILPETLTALKSLYPEDKAVGYGENEVRGIWSISFDLNN